MEDLGSIRQGKHDIYSVNNAIYILKSDKELIKFSGKDKQIIEKIIDEFAVISDPKEVFSLIKDSLNNDLGFFYEVIEWLCENNVLVKQDQEVSKSKKINIGIYGSFVSPDSVIESLRKKINCIDKVKLYSTIAVEEGFDIDEVNAFVILSPLFTNYSTTSKLNKKLYESEIPYIHLSFEGNSFTIGPLMHSKFGTPCLDCYKKRKLANLDNPEGLLKFINIPNKKVIAKNSDPTNSPFFKIAVEFLARELEKISSSIYPNTALLAHDVTFNGWDYTSVKNKIFKLPFCEICSNVSIEAQFNS